MSDLHRQAARLGIKPPGVSTLRRYGLTAEEWLGFLAAQGWVCPICRRRANVWNTDHHHQAGWKNFPPEERKRYVRGVLCAWCNHRIVHSKINGETAQRIADYIKAWEARRDGT